MNPRNIDRPPSDALASAARDKRQQAEKTRRLALTLTLNDRQTLQSYAEELEREAYALERRATQADTGPVAQRQQQQQGPAEKEVAPTEPTRKP